MSDIILIAGDVASTAAVIKTIIAIMGLPKKKPEESITVKVKNPTTGLEIDITSSDETFVSAEIAKVLNGR